MKIWTLGGGQEGVCTLVSLFLLLQEPSNVTCHLSHREKREAEELAKHRAERPKIQRQFADLKRGLSAVTDEEWDNIPEVGNLTRRKRKRDERSFAVPDSILVGDRSKNEYENSLDPMQQEVCHLYSRTYTYLLTISYS